MQTSYTRQLLICVLGLVVLGCRDSIDSTGIRANAIAVRGIVLDSTGTPVMGALVGMWVESTSGRFGSPLDDFSVSDQEGYFALRLDSLPGIVLDSVHFRVVSPGCGRAPHITTVPAPSLVADGQAELQVTITQPGIKPRARTMTGRLCANGTDTDHGPAGYWLALRIDSVIGTVVHGIWNIEFRRSIGGGAGSLLGLRWDDNLILELRRSPEPVANCPEMTLAAQVSAGDVWGPAVVMGAQACFQDPEPFVFVQDSSFPAF